MKKKNRIFITFFIKGVFAIIIGAYFKISTNNPNADLILIIGFSLQFIAVTAFLLNNFKAVKELLNR